MPPTDRKRANLIVGVIVAAGLTAGLGWMALKTSVSLPELKPSSQRPVFDAEWLKLPVPDDVVRVYPAKAKAERLASRALVEMRCVIAEGGRLEGCAIFDESVPGYGFSAAALGLADRFQIKTTARDGSSLVGLPVTVPMAFDPIYAPKGP
jgi:hypothetical protein